MEPSTNSTSIPNGIHEDALVGYLHTATLCTTDLETYQRFYGDAMEMQIDGPLPITDEDKNKQRKRWNIPREIDYDLYHIYRAAVPSLVHLRVLHLKTATPHIHKSYNSRELGSFSLGFPTSDAKSMDVQMQKFGVDAMAPMQKGEITRKDGIGYYLETIYQGPDFLHCVGIERVDYAQLAPCDPDSIFCGPGYSAFVPKDSDAEVAFYKNVLGFFTLFDVVWETAEGSALGTGSGIPFRFASIYAQGTNQNHILILDFQDEIGNIETGVESHIPNQGLGMYTFQTSDIEEVYRKAIENGTAVLSPITNVNDKILGQGKTCLLQSPNGMYIEIFQGIKD